MNPGYIIGTSGIEVNLEYFIFLQNGAPYNPDLVKNEVDSNDYQNFKKGQHQRKTVRVPASHSA